VSKYRFRDSDIYLPGSELPANRLGITDPEFLHEIEQDYGASVASGAQGNAYIEASIACVRGGDHAQLSQIILAGLIREDRE